jgi:radical SAM protein with 4Fe4S-binding SPASM domain
VKKNMGENQILRLLFWETTTKCNLACAYCRRLETNETAVMDLSTNQAKNLIEQLAELGRNQPQMPVLVFSGGEPLCREDLFELVDHSQKNGIISALATNGTLIDSLIAKQIRKSGFSRVAVSLDGATADVHDSLRKLDGAFEKAIKGIKFLSNEEIPFQINVTLTKHNAGQLKDIYELAKSLGAVALHIFMLVPVGCGQTLTEEDILSAQQYEQKLIEISTLENLGELQVKVTCGPHYQRVIRQKDLNFQNHSSTTKRSSVPGESKHKKISRGCLAGIGVLFVAHQGDVFPCGYLPVKCGNILEEKLSEIWYNSVDLARMRDSDALEGKCGICSYRQLCGGCRARAYAATGNYMAQEPFCVYIPDEK